MAFNVTVETKTNKHPYYNVGHPTGYVINNIQGVTLCLDSNKSYKFKFDFDFNTHPFYLSTDKDGQGEGELDYNIKSKEFTLNMRNFVNKYKSQLNEDNYGKYFYYQCKYHLNMGWKIYINDNKNNICNISRQSKTQKRNNTNNYKPYAVHSDIIKSDIISFKEVATGFVSLTDIKPVYNTDKLIISDQIGIVWMWNKNFIGEPTKFLDVKPMISKIRNKDGSVGLNPGYDERGLLSAALHPEQDKQLLFIYYSYSFGDGSYYSNCLSSFKYNTFEGKIDLSTEIIHLRIEKNNMVHNGGKMIFDKDYNLYLSVGDDTSPNNFKESPAQNTYGFNDETLKGKILKFMINFDNNQPILVPSIGNPFINNSNNMNNKDYIYAYGLRNPWGLAISPLCDNNLILITDAGSTFEEEINMLSKGANYGWPIYEGNHKHIKEVDINHTQPIYSYDYKPGGVIIGGELIWLNNTHHFLFSDFSSKIYLLSENDSWTITDEISLPDNTYIKSFGHGNGNYDVYALSSTELGPSGNTSSIWKLQIE